MTVLTAELLAQFKETIESQKAESIDALNRTFDGSFDVEVESDGPISEWDSEAKFGREGLVLGMSVDDQGLLFILPQSDGFVPDWCKNPDPTGESKLATLAQELGMTMVPEDAMPMDFSAKYVKSISDANSLAKIDEAATGITVQLKNGDQSAEAYLIWPAEAPLEIKNSDGVGGDEAAASAPAEAAPAPQPAPQPVPQEQAAPPAEPDLQLQLLPAFTRSLLKVEIPMCVTLVKSKRPIGKVRELSPGSIIQFEKKLRRSDYSGSKRTPHRRRFCR